MVELKHLNKTKKNDENVIKMICLNPECKALFKIESNGRRLYYEEEYQTTTKYKGKVIICPICKSKKTKFNVKYKL